MNFKENDTMSYVMGVDPGAAGAIAIVNLTAIRAYFWNLKEHTWDEVNSTLQEIKPYVIQATIEKVNAFPRDSRSGAFKFGENYGKLQMGLIAAKIPFDKTSPVNWKAAMKLPKGASKRDSRELAKQFYPGIKITNDNAEAVLIAEYTRIKCLRGQ